MVTTVIIAITIAITTKQKAKASTEKPQLIAKSVRLSTERYRMQIFE